MTGVGCGVIYCFVEETLHLEALAYNHQPLWRDMCKKRRELLEVAVGLTTHVLGSSSFVQWSLME